MSDALLAVVFVIGVMLSLGASWVLVTRLERVGARFGLSEALLGLLAALAADAPEITTAVTALAGHHARTGAGVVIGSNVFNLAALLGLAAVVAGEIALHRRVIVMSGAVALWIGSVCLAVVIGVFSPAVGLAVGLVAFVPYMVILGMHRDRLSRMGLPAAWASWLRAAIQEEELELEAAIHPRRGQARDAAGAAIAMLVVVGASIAMEQAASALGNHYAVPEIVVGGLMLAAVTSLPNAVAAVYLAARGRGVAVLSTALNSNALNVVVGLLLPATIVGLGAPSTQTTLVAAWYLGLTVFAMACAYVSCGLRRSHGMLIIGAYLAFVGVLLAVAYSAPIVLLLSAAGPIEVGIVLAAWLMHRSVPQTNEWAVTHVDGRERHRASTEPMVRYAPTHDQSLIAGWSVRRVWWFALALSSIVAATDAVLGSRVTLIGLLVVGPCCATLTGRWPRTAAAGAWAIVLAVLLGLPDEIWGTWTHLTFLGAVIIVVLVSTSSTVVIERLRYHNWP